MENERKICCACGKEKDLKNFYKNNQSKTGYDRRCKICKTSQIKCARRTQKRISQRKKEFAMNRPTKKDYETMYEFLKLIGYNPHNVHADFCEKYGLKPKKRGRKNKNFFTPQDLNI